MTPIQSAHLTPAEFKRTVFYASPLTGTKPEDLLDPEYWVHVARSLAPGNKIEAFAEDGSFYVELLVLGPIAGGVKVAFLFEPKVFAEATIEDIIYDGHTLRYAGNRRKWTVTRNAAGRKPAVLLRDGFANSEDARTYVKEQRKAQAA